STEEPTGKSKRVKRPAKKTTKAPAKGVVIRENPEIPVYKKKEKVDVTRGKGIELLSQVALNEDAQFEEVRKKSMRDFHKTHPSGFSVVKIIPSVTSEGTGVKPGVPDVTEEESSESEAESWGNDEDDSNNEQESSGENSDQKNDSDDDKTQSDNENESNSEHEIDENESDETKITDKAEGDEDEKIDYTTCQLYDDEDIWLNEPADSDKGFKTEVLVTSSSHSSDLAAKILNFSDIPHTDAEIVSPMDVHIHYEVPSQQTPTLLIVPVLVISDSSPRSQKDKDKDPSTGSDRGLKKRKTGKDASPATEELEFEITDLDMPQDQEENLGNDDEEPKEKVASKCDWFTKPTQP
ncbi:hypothetical protein Tco_1026271, partial [Tanacetum coccineum]